MKAVGALLCSVFVMVLLFGVGLYNVEFLPDALISLSSSAADAPVSAGTSTAGASAAPFTGTSSGCTQPDPTNPAGCLTPATAWLYQQVQTHFASQPAHCWDRHAWNPTSDHPLGKACDFSIGRAGAFPDTAATARGWALATWLRANATALHVHYVIWDDKIWSTDHDSAGWRTYTGGGIYDASTPTGGHYDHVHVSTKN